MAILQFAFGTDPQAPDFKPHNYPRNRVVYTGTHDNDTTVGWWSGDAGHSTRSERDIENEREHARRYLGLNGQDVHWAFIRAVLASVADTAIVPATGSAWPGKRGAHESARHAQRQLALAAPARTADGGCRTKAGGDGRDIRSDLRRIFGAARSLTRPEPPAVAIQECRNSATRSSRRS